MLSQGVISSLIILAIILGGGSLITAIILLATKKLKGSTFWLGLATAAISNIIVAIVQYIFLGSGQTTESLTSPTFMTILQVIAAVIDVGFILLFLGVCVKRNRTFEGAISFAAGFTTLSTIGGAFAMISYYMNGVMLNSGTLDAYIKQGVVDKETVLLLKQTLLELTVPSLWMTIINYAAIFMLITSVSILILKGVTNKKPFPDIFIALLAHLIFAVCSTLIENEYAATGAITAIALAVFIYTLKIRGDIKVDEPVKIEDDPFMQTVNASRQPEEDKPEEPSEFNPYE